ncbi:hypothetical protein GYMLUDRAFT_40715, partial [Collybiopsis luxurians FD-317 M1]
MPLKITFISGPLETAGSLYFQMHYQGRIDRAISLGHQFIMGPAAGIDSEALAYLVPRVSIDRLTIYVHHQQLNTVRPHLRWFEDQGGKIIIAGKNHTERDEACTRNSHYDILRYRTEEECRALYGAKWRDRISGTEKNEKRRAAGVGLIWTEGEAKPDIFDEKAAMEEQRFAKDRKKLERKVKGQILQARKNKGEVLQQNQLEKLSKLAQWEVELERVYGTTLD